MGLSAMGNTPGMDEALRYANNAGHEQHLSHSAWTGENGMHELGMGEMEMAGLSDGSSEAAGIINALATAGTNIATAFQKNKAAKRANAPAPTQKQGKMSPVTGHGGGGGGGDSGGGELFPGISNTTIYIGAGVVGVGLLFLFLKKKPGAGQKVGG